MDPGVNYIPYHTIFDARKIVMIDELMASERLGPNGALIRATEILAERVDELIETIAESDCDYIVIDTPEQMEVFAFANANGEWKYSH